MTIVLDQKRSKHSDEGFWARLRWIVYCFSDFGGSEVAGTWIKGRDGEYRRCPHWHKTSNRADNNGKLRADLV